MKLEARLNIRKYAESIQKKIYGDNPIYPLKIDNLIKDFFKGEIREDFNEPLADAQISRKGNSFLIEIKKDLNKRRKRFTLAHELGHLFLHMGYKDEQRWNSAETYVDGAFRRTSGDFSVEEQEANEFAGSFLMPENEFRKIVKKNMVVSLNMRVFDLDGIAEHFGVSTDSVRVRAKWLGIF